jgi:hypothetical protein
MVRTLGKEADNPTETEILQRLMEEVDATASLWRVQE